VAVYERSYRGYSGELTPPRARVMIFPRYAFEDVLRSKFFLTFLVLCLVWSFGLACILYVPHNLGFAKAFRIDPEQLTAFFAGVFDADWFFNWFMVPTGAMALLITIIVGPVLVTSDMRNNGLALYFARPLTRTDYTLGKSLVLVSLLSVVTWMPGLLLFLFQTYLEGLSWARANWRVGFGIFVGAWIWMVVLCLISLALSAHVKWRPVARISLIVVFFVAAALANTVNWIFETHWGSVIDIGGMIRVIWDELFGIGEASVPLWAAVIATLGFCAMCVGLLARKLRPYEVVR
jgi:ABC-2 type transport system permease protein